MSEMDPEWEAKVDKILEPIFEQIHKAGIVDTCDAILSWLQDSPNATVEELARRVAECRKKTVESMDAGIVERKGGQSA